MIFYKFTRKHLDLVEFCELMEKRSLFVARESYQYGLVMFLVNFFGTWEADVVINIHLQLSYTVQQWQELNGEKFRKLDSENPGFLGGGVLR